MFTIYCLIKASNFAKNSPTISNSSPKHFDFPSLEAEFPETLKSSPSPAGWDEPWSSPIREPINSSKQQEAGFDNSFVTEADNQAGKPRQGSSSSLRRSNAFLLSRRRRKKLSNSTSLPGSIESGGSPQREEQKAPEAKPRRSLKRRPSSLQVSRARSQLKMSGMLKYLIWKITMITWLDKCVVCRLTASLISFDWMKTFFSFR